MLRTYLLCGLGTQSPELRALPSRRQELGSGHQALAWGRSVLGQKLGSVP